MSKCKVPSLDRSKATSAASLSSYQSVWMAHWKVAKPSPLHKSNLLSLNCETRDMASDSTSGQEVTSSPSHVSKMDRQCRKVPVKNTVNVMNVVTDVINIMDGSAVAVVSRNLTEEEPVSAPSTALGLTQQGNTSFTPRNEQASSCSYDEASNPLTMQSSSRNWIEGYVDGKKSVVVSVPFPGSPLRPISRQEARCLDADGNSLTLSTEKLDRRASATTPSPWNRAASLLQSDNPATGQERLLTFLAENHRQGSLDYHQAFPSQSNPLEATKRETLCYENSSRQSHPVIDMKTTTTQTFVDSNERLTAGQPEFSQTTHRLVYSEKTDTLLSERRQMFRESTVCTNYEGIGTFGQFLSLSMNGNYHDNPGVKLQPLWSLSDSEGHENLAKGRTSAVAMKSESSAETNTLDMDALPEKQLAGEATSSSKKEPSAGKGTGSLVKVDLRERKRKFLSLATSSSSTENGEPSPSKTQSLEAEHLLPHDDPSSHSKPGSHSGDHRGPEPRYLRMKQLKASASDHHPESLKSGDESPVEKVKNLFGGTSKQMKVTSEPVTADTLDEQQQTGSGCSARSAKDGASTSGDNTSEAEKGRRVLLSDPWIRRWCHNNASALPKKQDLGLLFESLGTKAFDELQKKQMPSVAAMALMGKAMKGFHPCEFKRKGSFVVWNS